MRLTALNSVKERMFFALWETKGEEGYLDEIDDFIEKMSEEDFSTCNVFVNKIDYCTGLLEKAFKA